METTFRSLGVAQDISQQLEHLSISVPTPIQARAIPIALTGADLIGIAQTGTGKTLAFGVPMIQRLSRSGTKALILLPTRELAEQVEASLVAVGKQFGLRTTLIIGGASMGKQIQSLKRKPHVVIATPGRLVDHLGQGTINLSAVGILVLDEADRMLDMGFAPQVNQIFERVPHERQTLLFSATMPDAIRQLAAKYLTSPQTVAVSPAGTTVEKVEQELHVVDRAAKIDLLQSLLRNTTGPVLVFTRTKHGAKKLCRTLTQLGHRAAEIHGNRSLPQRREALAGFKSGAYHVLVATDVAARGIDVSGIELVVNFDLPEQAEDYVHRIGRTARAGRAGRAVSFATPDQHRDVREIERSIRAELPRTHHAPFHHSNREQGSFRRIEPRQQQLRPYEHRRSGQPQRRFHARPGHSAQRSLVVVRSRPNDGFNYDPNGRFAL